MLGPKGSRTHQIRPTVCDDMFACWLVMLYAVEAVGGDQVRLLGPKGSPDTADMSVMYDICVSSSRGEIVPEDRLLGPMGSQHPRMA